MSYNDNADLNDIWITESDIYTLQKIWGEEKDPEKLEKAVNHD